ncbi:MAG: hypothetical protein U0L17_03395 [Acutalibacteraceae bacterium]|nr:hypothetical protein [Acutalibacteraceae bacterium]
MKKDIKIFNVVFPLWFIFLAFPTAWLIAIPSNFIIDSIVLLIAIKLLKFENCKKFYKSTILKVFVCGFAADFVGAVLMLCTVYINIYSMGDELYFTIPALLISAAMIYFFDYKIAFEDCDKHNRKVLSLVFAIATAPYTFLVPTSWIYG